jgi:hypothetical protein
MAESPENNTFEQLPYPSPGERIRADDFATLSRSLKTIYDTYILSSALFGSEFGQAKLTLTSQQYAIHRVMSVFGTELGGADDESLNNRKVLHVAPAVLGERRVIVIVSEVVETRRFAPNLLGLTYTEASERLRSILADVTFPSTPAQAPNLVGRALSQARETLYE